MVVVQKGEKCTKKRDARAKLLSLLIEPFDFLTFSLPSESLDLKVPIKYGEWKTHQNGSVDANQSMCCR